MMLRMLRWNLEYALRFWVKSITSRPLQMVLRCLRVCHLLISSKCKLSITFLQTLCRGRRSYNLLISSFSSAQSFFLVLQVHELILHDVDAKTLYYCALTGLHLYKVKTSFLQDFSMSDSEVIVSFTVFMNNKYSVD